MDENLVRWLSLLGVALFVGLAILFANRINRQRRQKLQQEFENKFSMFKVFFNKSNTGVEELGELILLLKRSKSGRFILPIFICLIMLVIGIFYRGSINSKLIMLAILAIWFVWCTLNATNYLKLYKNAIVSGNLIKKKTIWFYNIDSIEAKLYDYNGVMDARQAQVYRVYDVKRNGKVILGIWETEFSNARMIERCFDIDNPLVTSLQESFDTNELFYKEDY
ncbi:hypothetical protein QJV36_08900 [Listeria marthii]|uniref:hypothetical protein n=1 Tax=Listeria marthii TaxID=529731 RepID=UPI0028804E66|nr:hypothetical protein [Listeria marthii]MDT0091333.1 hypothetical protein [Listeria marthii]